MRNWVTCFQRGFRNWLFILVEQRQPNHARDATDAIVGKTNDQSLRSCFTICPDPGRAESISDDTVKSVDPIRVLAVIIHHVVSMDVMPVPQRPVIRAYIFDMRDDLFSMRYTVLDAERFGCAIRHAHFGDKRNMWRTMTGKFNLLRFDEDGI